MGTRLNVWTKDGYFYQDIMIKIDHTGTYIEIKDYEDMNDFFNRNQEELIIFHNGYREEVNNCLVEDISVFEIVK